MPDFKDWNEVYECALSDGMSLETFIGSEHPDRFGRLDFTKIPKKLFQLKNWED